MAGLKEIKNRLKSVKNTKKITYAMKLVSAAKLKKAQESVLHARDYTELLNKLLANLLIEQKSLQFDHPLMEKRPNAKNIHILIVGGSRGLCGGYTSNLNKKIESLIKELSGHNEDVNLSYTVVGKKVVDYFKRTKRDVTSKYVDLGEDALDWPIDDIAVPIEQGFIDRQFDAVYLVYTKFKSALSVVPVSEKILPMDANLFNDLDTEVEASGNLLFEPSIQEVFLATIPHVFRSRIRQAALDAKASEHGSRMTAMDSATKNAGDLIDKLQLKHNKLRQSNITSELLDIIGGAEAT